MPRHRDTLPLVRELRPDVVVADILTLAPALAAELEGVPLRDADPPRLPARRARTSRSTRCGARLPRTAAGRAHVAARAPRRAARPRARPRRELNETRASSACRALDHVHGGISRELALVATFPQLEYPRRWPAHVARRRPADVGAARGGRRAATRRRAARARRALDRAGPGAPAAARGAERARRRAGAGARDLEPAACPRAAARPRQRAGRRLGVLLRARCRAATSSSATPATARSCARSPAAAPSSPARPSAT